jgi:hypothetical protein
MVAMASSELAHVTGAAMGSPCRSYTVAVKACVSPGAMLAESGSTIHDRGDAGLDPELDRQGPAIQQGDVLVRVDVLELLAAGDHVDVGEPEDEAVHVDRDAIVLEGIQRVLVGVPVHLVRLRRHGNRDARRHRPLGDRGAACRSRRAHTRSPVAKRPGRTCRSRPAASPGAGGSRTPSRPPRARRPKWRTRAPRRWDRADCLHRCYRPRARTARPRVPRASSATCSLRRERVWTAVAGETAGRLRGSAACVCEWGSR